MDNSSQAGQQDQSEHNSSQVTASRIRAGTGVNTLKRPYSDAPDAAPHAAKGPAQRPAASNGTWDGPQEPGLAPPHTALPGDEATTQGRKTLLSKGRHLWESQLLATELQLRPGSSLGRLSPCQLLLSHLAFPKIVMAVSSSCQQQRNKPPGAGPVSSIRN